MEFLYDAYQSVQTAEGKPLVLFAAPAVDIEQWAGIPQRGRLDGQETVGFQREQKQARVNQLADFFADQRNIVQNPLLAALQNSDQVEFIAVEDGSPFGKLKIVYEDYEALPMLTLLRRLAGRLENRTNGMLNPQAIIQARVTELVEKFADQQGIIADDGEESDEDSIPADESLTSLDSPGIEDTTDAANVLFTDETQIIDFYNEIQGRIEILVRYGRDDMDEVLGFTKDAILGYLKPAVLVDGQHRLRGAIAAAKRSAETGYEDAVLDAVAKGVDPVAAERQVLSDHARSLPVSLLMDASPSEHVFQFIVVNQKATPMGKALLGTIVSTSLSHEELQPIAQRLEDAGIKLQDSQAVAYLTRWPGSPFCGLVQTGMSGDQKNLLQWNVLRGLVSVFRELRGKPYHDVNDFARAWEENLLDGSGLVAGAGDMSAKEYWRQLDGPWRDVFIRFYTRIRDEFGDTNDLTAPNAWGNTENNLYNKVTLTILATDYFQYLYTQRLSLDSLDDVDRSMDDWLQGVNRSYFNREWPLRGMKKDIPAIRVAWSQIWFQYRNLPNQLPAVTRYRGKA
jgi:hypothetical protein